MPYINSSAISFVDYNQTSRELTITFTSGGTYTYYDVPPAIYTALLASNSKGRYYNKFIKDKYLEG